jgi:hypothetical protein
MCRRSGFGYWLGSRCALYRWQSKIWRPSGPGIGLGVMVRQRCVFCGSSRRENRKGEVGDGERVPFVGSQMASGAQTMPAEASSTVTSLSLVQLTRSVLSQTKIPREPFRWATSHVVASMLRSVPTMYHFFPASAPPPLTIAGSRTPLVPLVGLMTGCPPFNADSDVALLPSLR